MFVIYFKSYHRYYNDITVYDNIKYTPSIFRAHKFATKYAVVNFIRDTLKEIYSKTNNFTLFEEYIVNFNNIVIYNISNIMLSELDDKYIKNNIKSTLEKYNFIYRKLKLKRNIRFSL